MAFVQPNASTLLRRSSFTSSAIDSKRPCVTPCVTPVVATSNTIRMCAPGTEQKEPKVVGTAGDSEWKENVFVGGFPGGEGYFQQWVENGMKADVPDMPKFMQPSAEFKPEKPAPKGGILGLLDRTEFFEDFIGQNTQGNEAESESESESGSNPMISTTSVTITQDDDSLPSDVLKTEIPDDTVYGKYYPEKYLNIAPHFIFDYDRESKTHQYDRVGCAMLPVVASPVEAYYPKDVKNKAPVIDIFYSGSLNTASITLSLDFIEPLPTIPPPPKSSDEAIVSLLPGSGGGLKLNYGTSKGEKIPL